MNIHHRITQQLAAQRVSELRRQAASGRLAPKPKVGTTRVRFLRTGAARVVGR
jgi:hypothetical protein